MRAKNITFNPAGLSLKTDQADLSPIELVVAENVDLRRGRSARRRKGSSQVLAGKFFSFWDDGASAYVVKDTAGVITLNEFLSDFTVRQLTTLSVAAPLAYEKVNATVVVSNGVDLGFIENGAFVTPDLPTATHMRATVAGEFLSEQNGRLLIGRQSAIYFTISHDLEAMDERYCQIPLPKPLTMMTALKTGVWVAYEGAIAFFAGRDPGDYTFDFKSPAAVVRGTAIKTRAKFFAPEAVSDAEAVIFMTEHGPCLGTEGGELQFLTEDQISAGVGEFGAGFVREADGYVHYVGSVQNADAASNTYTLKTISVDSQTS